MRSVLCFSFLLFYFSSHAQRKITGKVTAADNGKAIVAAYVYLSNTSIGSSTNEKGEFSLDHLPAGRFDVIVSFTGYEAYMIKVEPDQLPPFLEIVLKPKVTELNEVIVESYDKSGWDKYSTIFLDNFLGTSSFASSCELKNKDVLRFHFNKKTNTLSVHSVDRLEIENRALGYILKYDLTGFDYNYDTKEFYFEGYPFFEEMETKRLTLQKRWIENREEAYYGSLIHFMRTVYNKRLNEEGFEVRKLIPVTAQERDRVKKLYRSKYTKHDYDVLAYINTSPVSPNQDSLEYYKKVNDQPTDIPVILNRMLPADSISIVLDSITHGLTFDGHLQVMYRPKKNPLEYRKYVSRGAEFLPVSSEIFRTSDAVIRIFPDGSFYDGRNFMNSGYWSWWEKMCNKLPYDYIPQPKKTVDIKK